MVVKLRDIAASVGVSQATVSLALSGNPRITEATRNRVIAAADRMGYRPNRAARALRREKTEALGLIISDVANPFFGELAHEVERQARLAGYALTLCNSDEDAAREMDYLHNLLAGSQVDGVLLVPAATTPQGLERALRSDVPLVMLDRPAWLPGDDPANAALADVPTVRSDTREALDEAAQWLVSLGHSRIGIIAPPLATPLGHARHAEIRDALVRQGIALTDICTEEGNFREASGFTAMARLLDDGRPPTAIVVADGPMGLGALKAIRRRGLRVPTDMSLICFDDSPWSELLDPPMSVITQPIAAMAQAAVTALCARIDGHAPVQTNDSPLTCRFVRRASCGVPGG